MHEKEEVLAEGSSACGTPCPACRKPLAAGDTVVACPRCKTVHHTSCWVEQAGCSRLGCPQTAALASPEPRRRPEWETAKKSLLGQPAGMALVAALILGLSITAISIRNSRFGPAAAPPPAIRFMTWDPAYGNHPLNRVVDEWNAKHTDVQVSLEVTPMMAYEQKLVILMAAQDPPDIFALQTERLPFYAEKGAALNLDSFWQESGKTLPIPRERLQKSYVNGELYGVPNPAGNGVLAVWARTKIPDQAWEFLSFLETSLPPAKEEPFPLDTQRQPAGGFLPLGPGQGF